MGHALGRRAHDTDDASRNNAFVNLFAGGEGLHNNHHYRPAAACTAEHWWDFDPVGWFIRLMGRMGDRKSVV